MKAAIIGLGVIAKVHAEVLRDNGIEIVAVCDIDEEKTAFCKELCPNAVFYTDYKQMLFEVKPDAVHICTPHYLHAQMVVFALENNINVLCEKPLCINTKEIDQIIEAEKKSQAILGVVLQNRYNDSNIFVKDYLKDKEVIDGVGNVVWHRDAEYYASGAWRGKKNTEGGGVLINQALHTLDLMQWFVGMPEYATATVSNLSLQDTIEVEDTAAVLYYGATSDTVENRSSNFSFFATNGSNTEFPVEITIKTETGIIKLLPDCVLINGKPQNFAVKNMPYGKCCYGTGHEKLVADFYHSIEKHEKFWIDGVEGSKVVRLILGAYSSNGKKVKI